MSKRFVLAEKS